MIDLRATQKDTPRTRQLGRETGWQIQEAISLLCSCSQRILGRILTDRARTPRRMSTRYSTQILANGLKQPRETMWKLQMPPLTQAQSRSISSQRAIQQPTLRESKTDTLVEIASLTIRLQTQEPHLTIALKCSRTSQEARLLMQETKGITMILDIKANILNMLCKTTL